MLHSIREKSFKKAMCRTVAKEDIVKVYAKTKVRISFPSRLYKNKGEMVIYIVIRRNIAGLRYQCKFYKNSNFVFLGYEFKSMLHGLIFSLVLLFELIFYGLIVFFNIPISTKNMQSKQKCILEIPFLLVSKYTLNSKL